MFYIFLLLTLSDFRVSLDDIGAYEDLSIFKIEQGFLLSSRADGVIAIVNGNGAIAASYSKKGQGPEELQNHAYMGLYKGKHMVLSDNGKVIAFDDKLNPVPSSLPDLPQSLAQDIVIYGFNVNEKWYWVSSGMSFQEHIVKQVSIDSTFQTKGVFPQKFTRAMAKSQRDFFELSQKNYRIDFHNEKAFRTTMTVPMVADEYSVEVFDLNDNQAPIMILTADLSEQSQASPFAPVRAFVLGGCKFVDGYAVMWQGKLKKSDPELTLFVDTFKLNGGFRKRGVLKTRLFPCVNGPEVFTIKEINGGEFLVQCQNVETLVE